VKCELFDRKVIHPPPPPPPPPPHPTTFSFPDSRIRLDCMRLSLAKVVLFTRSDASSSAMSSAPLTLSFPDRLTDRLVSLDLIVDGKLQSRHAAACANHAPAGAHAGGGVARRAAIARHEAASRRIAAAPRSHADAVFAVCASARHVRLHGDRVPSTGHRACRCARDVPNDGALGCVDNGACDAGSRDESSGAAAAARVLCCALRLSCQCLRALCV
jgi:hypothetical protein